MDSDSTELDEKYQPSIPDNDVNNCNDPNTTNNPNNTNDPNNTKNPNNTNGLNNMSDEITSNDAQYTYNLNQTNSPQESETPTTSQWETFEDTEALPKEFKEHSQRQLSDDDLLLAATLILDAKRGRNVNFKPQAKYVRSYLVYEHWVLVYLLYLAIFVDLALALFEKPSVPGLRAPYYATMVLELLCLIYFTIRTVHGFYFDYALKFWKDPKNIIIIVLIVLTAIDMVCYIVWVQLMSEDVAIRWSRPLRPLFIINFPQGRQIRRAFRNIRRTLDEILTTFVLFIFAVMLFALLALKLFLRRTEITYRDGSPYFKNYLDSFWDMYVLVTTANNPDVMMPAYDQNNWFAIFFIVYVIICLYIFMSIVLAVIYNNYKKNLKNEVQVSVYTKRKKLGEAFRILRTVRNGQYIVSAQDWHAVMKIVEPKRSEVQISLLLSVLDVHGVNCIERKHFLTVADLIRVELSEVKDRMIFLEKVIPRFYNSRPSQLVCSMVRTRAFRIFFDVTILINAIIIAIGLDQADWFFLVIFLLEIFLKMYTYGLKLFFSVFWNTFDFLIIGSAFIASVVLAIEGATNDEMNTLDLLLVLRVLRLVKLFVTINRFKVIITTILNIGPSILTYGGVIFIFYYVFAIIGMEVFGGKITYYGYTNVTPAHNFCGNKRLNGSEFFYDRYCGNNFNNILRAMVVLFELTVVNQWHVLSSGFVLVTGKAARIYFFFFHLSCVVIILNIFVAFILEAFILEYSISKMGSVELAVESKIKDMGLGIGIKKTDDMEEIDEKDLVSNEILPHCDCEADNEIDVYNDDGLRFHLKKKSSKKVEVLLQQMFEGEIDPEDEGPEEMTMFEDLERHRPRGKSFTIDIIT